jgi:hypothetical protein
MRAIEDHLKKNELRSWLGHVAEPPAGPRLGALAGVDDTIEQLQQSVSALRKCMEGGLSGAEAAPASTTPEPRGETARHIATSTHGANQQRSALRELYIECEKPMKRTLERLTADLACLEAERDALTMQLPTELARRHGLLRKSARYPYISGIAQGRCTGCNMRLPTLFAQEVERGRFDFCPSCKRILSAGPTPSEQQEQPIAISDEPSDLTASQRSHD